MVYQPPTGARDLLPLDVAQKRWIEKHLQSVFHRWGYHRIITSTVERLETLMAGGAIQSSTVIQLQSLEDERLGLRPELTASIARAAATRMAVTDYPQRLYYSGSVFRQASKGSHSSQHEFYQTGVELLGGGGTVADAEVLLLLADGLNQLGLDHWHLVLGEASLTRSLLSIFPTALRPEVQRAIAQLDRVALETMALSPELRQRALLLLDLRGQPMDVLQRVASLELDDEQRAAVNQLKSLIDLLQESAIATGTASPRIPNLILDLSLLQTFDYYTGIVFEVVSPAGGQRVLGQGGRYDQLLGLYHPQGETAPGIGFCLNLEDLHQTLLQSDRLPYETPASHWLVVAASPQAQAAAFAHAQTLRGANDLARVEVYLDESMQPEAVRQYARDRKIAQIAWIQADGQPEVESL
jgi:ATP phosphoribosyltransferase regulatory subunit